MEGIVHQVVWIRIGSIGEIFTSNTYKNRVRRVICIIFAAQDVILPGYMAVSAGPGISIAFMRATYLKN